MVEIRTPLQKRSIEKRNRIIDKGFELMCNNGYYNTNTAEIAKYAGVSTGIIYQYFTDKKDILIEGVKKYSNEIMFPIYMLIDENEKLPSDLKPFFKKVIETNKKMHTASQRAHQELTALEHFNKENLKEKTHLIVNLIDSLAHEEAYHKHPNLDYDKMEDIVIDSIIDILK